MKGRKIGVEKDTQIRELIALGLTDREIARRCDVSTPTVAIRRAAVPGASSGDGDYAAAATVVISALRHLAASSGLTAAERRHPARLISCSVRTPRVVYYAAHSPPTHQGEASHAARHAGKGFRS